MALLRGSLWRRAPRPYRRAKLGRAVQAEADDPEGGSSPRRFGEAGRFGGSDILRVVGLTVAAVLVPLCIAAIRGRYGTGRALLLPIVLLTYAIVAGSWSVFSIVHQVAAIPWALSGPSGKAALIGLTISVLMNATFGLLIHIPFLAGAYFIDRWMLNRSMAKTT
jgi:hypothetical protein